MDHIGTIHGKLTSSKFEILLSETDVERESYIKIHHEIYGWVLAKIDGINRYIEAEREITIAKAHTIGYRREGALLVPKTPFRTTEKVYMADRALIANILGLKKSKENSIYIGLLEGYDIPVSLDTGKVINKHVSVLAKTGAGKSYTVGVLVEELIENRVPTIIIDPHGEYNTLKKENLNLTENLKLKYDIEPKSYDSNVIEYAPDTGLNPGAEKLTINTKIDAKDMIEIIPVKLNDTQKFILYNAVKRTGELNDNYNLDDLIDAVSRDESKSKWKIISALDDMKKSRIFEGKPTPYTDMVSEGLVSIINLKGVKTEHQDMIVTKIAKDLFEMRKANEIPKLFFLVEEAHNFCPERGLGSVASSEVLRTIASEGRKFGLRLGVVSQRPAKIDKNVLSQCSTQIILKITNPNDLKAVGQSIEGFTPEMEDAIQQLSVGHALIVGAGCEQAIIVSVRARRSSHGEAVIDKAKKKGKGKQKAGEKEGEKIEEKEVGREENGEEDGEENGEEDGEEEREKAGALSKTAGMEEGIISGKGAKRKSPDAVSRLKGKFYRDPELSRESLGEDDAGYDKKIKSKSGRRKIMKRIAGFFLKDK